MKSKIKFSLHAKEKMRSRGVKKADILAALREPDNVYDDAENGTIVSIKKVNGNSIIAAYKVEGDGAKVITIFYTTKLDKLIKAKTARGAWKKKK